MRMLIKTTGKSFKFWACDPYGKVVEIYEGNIRNTAKPKMKCLTFRSEKAAWGSARDMFLGRLFKKNYSEFWDGPAPECFAVLERAFQNGDLKPGERYFCHTNEAIRVWAELRDAVNKMYKSFEWPVMYERNLILDVDPYHLATKGRNRMTCGELEQALKDRPFI